jgi:hypothetical protein
MRVERVKPRFHQSVTMMVEVNRGERPLRVLVTPDGVLTSLVGFLTRPAAQSHSLAWQRKVVEAVGLLYDYSVARPRPTRASLRTRSPATIPRRRVSAAS